MTRDDVARRAGTSTAVVSYVINEGPRPVAEATRQRVLRAIDELGYRPNAVARALSRRSSDVIGLLVPNLDNPYFASLSSAIERAAAERGYSVFVGNTLSDDQRQARYVETFRRQQALGIILVGAGQEPYENIGPRTRDVLKRERDMPLVSTDRLPRGSRGSVLLPDNHAGAAEAVRHLLWHGHRRIAMLAGPRAFSAVVDREAGWRDALRSAGVNAQAQTVVHCAFDRYAAARIAARILTARRRPSAVFVHTDEQAIGLIHAANRAGIAVPDDMAIASFDGIREAALIEPPLTTIEQPLEHMGSRAIQLIVKQLDTPPSRQRVEVTSCPLVIRRSCGCTEEPLRGPRQARTADTESAR